MLLPADFNQRERVKSWMFVALNSVDPHVRNFQEVEFINPLQEWAAFRRASVIEILGKRLQQLSIWMQERKYLEDTFSAADIMMTMVLRNLDSTEVLL